MKSKSVKDLFGIGKLIKGFIYYNDVLIVYIS